MSPCQVRSGHWVFPFNSSGSCSCHVWSTSRFYIHLLSFHLMPRVIVFIVCLVQSQNRFHFSFTCFTVFFFLNISCNNGLIISSFLLCLLLGLLHKHAGHDNSFYIYIPLCFWILLHGVGSLNLKKQQAKLESALKECHSYYSCFLSRIFLISNFCFFFKYSSLFNKRL